MLNRRLSEVCLLCWNGSTNKYIKLFTESSDGVLGFRQRLTSIGHNDCLFIFFRKRCITQLSKLDKKSQKICQEARRTSLTDSVVLLKLLSSVCVYNFFGSKSIEFHPDLKQLAYMWMTVDFFSPVQHVVGTETWHSSQGTYEVIWIILCRFEW